MMQSGPLQIFQMVFLDFETRVITSSFSIYLKMFWQLFEIEKDSNEFSVNFIQAPAFRLYLTKLMKTFLKHECFE